MIRQTFILLSLSAALSACGKQEAGGGPAGDDARARGEVLGGTISDEMIPLDQLKSRAAPMRASPKPGGTDAAAEPEAGAEAEATAEQPEAETEDSAPELPEN